MNVNAPLLPVVVLCPVERIDTVTPLIGSVPADASVTKPTIVPIASSGSSVQETRGRSVARKMAVEHIGTICIDWLKI